MKIAIYVGPTNGGSVARISANLANEFLRQGLTVDLLIRRSRKNLIGDLRPEARLINLGTSNALVQILKIARYLVKERPKVLLTHRIRENVLCLRARQLSRSNTKIFTVIHGPMSVKLKNLKAPKRERRLRDLKIYYPQNEGIIAISRATAQDIRKLLEIPEEKIWTIPNPAYDETIYQLAQEPVSHPFWADPQAKVVLGVGRLEQEKDFFTLLRAFSRLVSEDSNFRLLILGEGSLRRDLEEFARRLSITGQIDLPGFVSNPYPYIQRASILALSSSWDALPTVLIESLALGTPVVSTDCGSGPREILEDGSLGKLVPIGDDRALARAIKETLINPPPPEILKKGARKYHSHQTAPLYLQAFGLV
ncbi:glycosyltransferase [Thermosulfuriphilus sp.]